MKLLCSTYVTKYGWRVRHFFHSGAHQRDSLTGHIPWAYKPRYLNKLQSLYGIYIIICSHRAPGAVYRIYIFLKKKRIWKVALALQLEHFPPAWWNAEVSLLFHFKHLNCPYSNQISRLKCWSPHQTAILTSQLFINIWLVAIARVIHLEAPTGCPCHFLALWRKTARTSQNRFCISVRQYTDQYFASSFTNRSYIK